MKRHYIEQTFVKLLFVALTFCYCTSLQAQDIHFSQFYHSPQNLNPALTGVFAGHQRFIGNYRSQWNEVPVNYLTFSGAYDRKIYLPNLDNGIIGAGAVFNYDRAGDSKLNLIQFALSGSYTHQLAAQHFAGLGVTGSFSQRSYDLSGLSFNTQFDGDIYNALLPTGEEDLLRNQNIFFGDFSVGLNYRYQKTKSRTRINAGGALYHINKPVSSFYINNEISIFPRFSLFGEMNYQITNKLDVLGRISLQFQDVNKEYVAGIAGRLYLDKDKNYNDIALQLGIGYRFHDFGDAIIPSIELLYSSWQVGLSYDVNISAFDVATNGQGGFELAVIYTLFRVDALDTYKNCIIF